MEHNDLRSFARVVIDSNLPQLDREFEYSVPENLRGEIALGSLVEVPFGKGKAVHSAYVVGLSDTKEYSGSVASISSVVSKFGILDPQTYKLCSTLAARQACTVADLISLAVPARAATVDKTLETAGYSNTSTSAAGWRRSILSNPQWQAKNSGIDIARELAKSALEVSGSTLIIVPDQRRLRQFAQALSKGGVAFAEYESGSSRVERYRRFCEASRIPSQVILGNRSAAFLPIRNLHTVILWDDGDGSFYEPTAPYLSTREIVLTRQQQEGFNLAFVSNSISTDTQRLCEIGYLEQIDLVLNQPRLATSEDISRIDSLAWKAIRQALDAKRPVLVQVAARGSSVSAYCKTCRERVRCRSCNGPIWVNGEGKRLCRWCNSLNLATACSTCGGMELVTGRAGSARTAAELGKAFPGTKTLETTGDAPQYEIKPGPQIVVSTPGAEPFVDGGYGAVVLLDAPNLLSRDSLKAREDSIRIWANAVALLGEGGRATLTGLVGETAQALSLWQMRELARRELLERSQLAFPPAIRMASVVSSPELLAQLSEKLAELDGVEPLGPLALRDSQQRVIGESRLLIRFGYQQTLPLAALLKQFQLDAAGGSKAFSAKSGRAVRPVRVRMEEVEVI